MQKMVNEKDEDSRECNEKYEMQPYKSSDNSPQAAKNRRRQTIQMSHMFRGESALLYYIIKFISFIDLS